MVGGTGGTITVKFQWLGSNNVQKDTPKTARNFTVPKPSNGHTFPPEFVFSPASSKKNVLVEVKYLFYSGNPKGSVP